MNFITFNGKIVNTNYIKFIEKVTGLNDYVNNCGIKMYIEGYTFYEWYEDAEERDASFKTLETILKH